MKNLLLKMVILVIGVYSLLFGLSHIRYTPVTGYFSQSLNYVTAWFYIIISILIIFAGYYYFRD